MGFLDAIETQMISNRLPLAGISIAALPCADTPMVLSLHWHGFIEHEVETELGPQFRYETVPSSCLQVNRRWRELRDIEHTVMDVAWELGAWDLTRFEMRPCMRPGAPTQEAIECHMAFGQAHPYFSAEHTPVSEVQDAEDMLDTAGRRGYLLWRFRPVRGGVWEEVSDDASLEPGGYRNLPCPQISCEFADTRCLRQPRSVVYRFGYFGERARKGGRNAEANCNRSSTVGAVCDGRERTAGTNGQGVAANDDDGRGCAA